MYMVYIHKIFYVHIDTADNKTTWLLQYRSVEKKNSAEKKFFSGIFICIYVLCI